MCVFIDILMKSWNHRRILDAFCWRWNYQIPSYCAGGTEMKSVKCEWTKRAEKIKGSHICKGLWCLRILYIFMFFISKQVLFYSSVYYRPSDFFYPVRWRFVSHRDRERQRDSTRIKVTQPQPANHWTQQCEKRQKSILHLNLSPPEGCQEERMTE